MAEMETGESECSYFMSIMRYVLHYGVWLSNKAMPASLTL